MIVDGKMEFAMTEPKRKVSVPMNAPRMSGREEFASPEALDAEENRGRSKGDLARTDWVMILVYCVGAVVVIGGAVVAWRGRW